MVDKKIQEKIFDLRTLNFNLAQGKITQKEFEAYLSSLPDEKGNFEEVHIQEENDEVPTEDSGTSNDIPPEEASNL